MKKIPVLIVGLLVVIAVLGAYRFNLTNDDIYVDVGDGRVLSWDEYTALQHYDDKIKINEPVAHSVVFSPLRIAGEARGFWFFEATFPIVVTDLEGKVLAESFGQATEAWMTEEFVPFEATVEFSVPENVSEGVLILKNHNASGLPEHEDSFSIPIVFK